MVKKSVTSAINSVHKNTASTLGDPRLQKEFGFPLVPPIQLSAAYSFDNPENLVSYHEHKYEGNRYCRDSNDGVFQLERYFDAMFPGCRSLVYGSGMSAMAAAIDVLAPQDGKVYVTAETYRKTSTYLMRQSSRYRYQVRRLERIDDLSSQGSEARGALLILETPSNPHLYLHDFDAVRVLKEKFDLRVIADISLAGLCNIDFDFSQYDCVTFSVTKYVSGHNDVMGGVCLMSDRGVFEDFWNLRSERGGIMDPFTSYLLLRSLRTYDLRLAKQLENARQVLRHLREKDNILRVYHPHTADADQREILKKYYEHGGSMISFIIDSDADEVLHRLSQLHSIKMAPSFGAVDTLIEVPAVMSHYGKSREEQEALGIEPDLVRLSVGCEPVEDLLRDIDFLFGKDR